MLPGNGCTAASVCHILTDLSQSDRQHAGAIVNEGALPRIVGISRRDGGSVEAAHSSIALFGQSAHTAFVSLGMD